MTNRRPIPRELEQAVRENSECEGARKRDQLTVQTGEQGLALLFFGDLESPIRRAIELARALRQLTPRIKVRMGVHAGPAYREASFRTNRALASGGLTLAECPSSCGEEGHILISATDGGFPQAAAELICLKPAVLRTGP